MAMRDDAARARWLRLMANGGVALALAFMAALGCSTRVDWSLGFEGVSERPGTFYEVRFQRDCAPDAEVFAQRIVHEGAGPEALSLSASEAAVFVIAFDAGCHAYARGCAPASKTNARIAVDLGPFDEDRCALGACPLLDRCGGGDAGFDAGLDAMVDAMIDDAGVDTGADASADAPVDAPPDVPPPRSECEVLREEGAWGCDDFETSHHPSVQWEVRATGLVDWVDAPERPGRTAARLRTSAHRDGAYLRVSNIPVGATEVWARVSTHLSNETEGRYDVAYLWGGEGDRGIALVLDTGRQFGVWVGSETPDYWNHYAGPALPVGWSCIELGFAVDDTNGSVEIHRDGELIRMISNRMTVSPNGPYQHLHFGIVTAFDAPRTLHIDDIVVGPRRIPCP